LILIPSAHPVGDYHLLPRKQADVSTQFPRHTKKKQRLHIDCCLFSFPQYKCGSHPSKRILPNYSDDALKFLHCTLTVLSGRCPPTARVFGKGTHLTIVEWV